MSIAAVKQCLFRLWGVALILSLVAGCESTPEGQATDGALGDGQHRDLRLRTDQGAPFGDAFLSVDAPFIDPGQDTDGDQLPDDFEALFAGLDPAAPDSDGDQIPDGEEDEDEDGLSAALEWAAWKLSPLEKQKASPLHKDLLVELDYQQGQEPSATVVTELIAAFAAADLTNPDGASGIALHLYVDERDLSLEPMNESLDDRLSYLGAHGPQFADAGAHVAKMVHVVLASQRPGSSNRGGDTVGSSAESPEKAGVLIYVENLRQLFPMCENPHPPKVSAEEALLSTLIHELGHTLQLGHDTEVGGGVNAYNIMSTDLSECALLKQRTRGVENNDPALGATEAPGRPRFSKAAAQLIKLTNKISVETNQFESGSGYEM